MEFPDIAALLVFPDMPAPVFSRSSFTIAAVISLISFLLSVHTVDRKARLGTGLRHEMYLYV